MIDPQSIDSAFLAYHPKDEQWERIVEAMKPGAHLLLLSSVKEHHLGAISAEDHGLEIRDTLAYVFADGDGGGAAMQLIAMTRKPLEGTVAANVLKWGCGGLNIDGCRVGMMTDFEINRSGRSTNGAIYGDFNKISDWRKSNREPQGRWPANLLHDGSKEVTTIFPSPHGAGHSRGGGLSKGGGSMFCGNHDGNGMRFGDSGSASRFFCAAPSIDDLIAYLIKLVTPLNGTVLTNCYTENLPKEYNYVTDC